LISGLGAAILHYKYIKSALSIWVWLQPFLIVNMQRSEIIVWVWDQPFFLVHM
jgi:hypothetical protein